MDRPIEETTATLCHECAHLYAMTHGIKDTSGAGNSYHNKRFKAIAEAHGLIIDHHAKYGWFYKPIVGTVGLHRGSGLASYPDVRGPDLGRYDRHRHREPYTRRGKWHRHQTTQTSKFNPPLDLPGLRHYHPLYQRGQHNMR